MNTKNLTIDNAYEYCHALTVQRESNFSIGFQLLPEAKRRAIHVVYAACRYLDDISDELKSSDITDLLALWKSSLDEIYEKGTSAHPIGVALGDVLKKFSIPKAGFMELIEGCLQDQSKKRYETFAELSRYCELVATSIAKLSLPIYGCRDYEKAFPWARDLSFAFQLTNILRDVRQDFENGRCYLPQNELKELGLKPGDFAVLERADQIKALYELQGSRCEAYFKKGRGVLQYLDNDSHRCVQVMAETYYSLLKKIMRDPLASLKTTVSLTQNEKRALITY